MLYKYVIYSKLKTKKGKIMALIVKKAESLFERFENQMELWADKLL